MASTTTAHNLRLGVNIDHVATIRNARGGDHPDPLRAAQIAIAAGADGITAHLREDRRHIGDDDIARLKSELSRPLNLEMAATDEMLSIALRHLPNACCLVPEKREERTTEGGLDVVGGRDRLGDIVDQLKTAGIRVSLFVEPDPETLKVSAQLGADIVELHTGTYCEHVLAANEPETRLELEKLAAAATQAHRYGLEVHAGHGLTYNTVSPIAEMTEIVELNIGHFLIGEAIFTGLDKAVLKMRAKIAKARATAVGD